MNTKVIGLIGLASGFIFGAVSTYYVVKSKYEQKAEEEIIQMREYYNSKIQKETKEVKVEKTVEEPKPISIDNYKSDTKRHDYTSHVEMKGSDTGMVNSIYVIDPEEYGDYESYDQVELIYTADHKLVEYMGNHKYEEVEDIDSLVMEDFADYFGEYEDDRVFIRNENVEKYFEIVASASTYAELSGE